VIKLTVPSSGQEKTQKLVAEAQRCISEVVFDPSPINETTIRPQIPSPSQAEPASPVAPSIQSPLTSPRIIDALPARTDSLRPSGLPSAGLDGAGAGSTFLAQSIPLPSPGLGMEEYTTPTADTHPIPPQTPISPTSNTEYDEFGAGNRIVRDGAGTMPTSSAGQGIQASSMSEAGRRNISLDAGARTGSQFSTVPARGRDSVSQYLLRDQIPPNTPAKDGQSSFSADIAEALAKAATFSSADDGDRNGPPTSYVPPGGLTESGLPRGAQAPVSQVAWVPKIGPETREANASIEEPIPNPYDGVEEEDEGGNEQDEDDTELAYARRQARPPRATKPATWENINGVQSGEHIVHDQQEVPQDVSTDDFMSTSSIGVSASDFPLPQN
jgi:hypothetical protein